MTLEEVKEKAEKCYQEMLCISEYDDVCRNDVAIITKVLYETRKEVGRKWKQERDSIREKLKMSEALLQATREERDYHQFGCDQLGEKLKIATEALEDIAVAKEYEWFGEVLGGKLMERARIAIAKIEGIK